MRTREKTETKLAELEETVEAMIAQQPELDGDYWSAFAAHADDVCDHASPECEEYVRGRLDGITARHGILPPTSKSEHGGRRVLFR
jgi:hypothetical protein